MITYDGDIWDLVDTHIIGIPTNGFVTRNGAGVMGAGLAKQAADRYPGIKYNLGIHLRTHGHVVGWVWNESDAGILSIPVKRAYLKLKTEDDLNLLLTSERHRYRIGNSVPGFLCKAEVSLIEQSMQQLNSFIHKNQIGRVAIPLLGCGNGELSYEKDLDPLLQFMDLGDEYTLVRGK